MNLYTNYVEIFVKIYNKINGIALGILGTKIIENMMERYLLSVSFLLSICGVAIVQYTFNKELNENIEKSMSAIYDDFIDDEDKTNDFVKKKVNDCGKL